MILFVTGAAPARGNSGLRWIMYGGGETPRVGLVVSSQIGKHWAILIQTRIRGGKGFVCARGGCMGRSLLGVMVTDSVGGVWVGV